MEPGKGTAFQLQRASTLPNDTWPKGLPWLDTANRERVDKSNEEFWFTRELIAEVSRKAPQVRSLLLFPETLGEAEFSNPASPWTCKDFRVWANQLGLVRSASYQCRFGRTTCCGPTAALAITPFANSKWVKGWPSITNGK